MTGQRGEALKTILPDPLVCLVVSLKSPQTSLSLFLRHSSCTSGIFDGTVTRANSKIENCAYISVQVILEGLLTMFFFYIEKHVCFGTERTYVFITQKLQQFKLLANYWFNAVIILS